MEISRKRFEIETNRKWPMADQMTTSSMMSRDPEMFKVVILISLRPVILYKIHLADICTLWAPSSLNVCLKHLNCDGMDLDFHLLETSLGSQHSTTADWLCTQPQHNYAVVTAGVEVNKCGDCKLSCWLNYWQLVCIEWWMQLKTVHRQWMMHWLQQCQNQGRF